MINLEKIKQEKCQPPISKKICPCTILPLPLTFQIPPSKGGGEELKGGRGGRPM